MTPIMSASTTSTTDLIETFIHDVNAAKKCFHDLNRPTKVELTALLNMLRENTANIPNPTCIGGQFKLSICITNGSEWLQAEMGQSIKNSLRLPNNNVPPTMRRKQQQIKQWTTPSSPTPRPPKVIVLRIQRLLTLANLLLIPPSPLTKSQLEKSSII